MQELLAASRIVQEAEKKKLEKKILKKKNQRCRLKLNNDTVQPTPFKR